MSPSFLQTTAIVVKVVDYGESDKIVTFFTETFGKITGIAKGAKRSKKRFVNKLEFFTLLEITVIPSRRSSLCLIDQANLLNTFPGLREHYHRYTGAMLMCEMIDQWTREYDSDVELFSLLASTLEKISTCRVKENVIFFLIKMLDILGFGLQLDHCIVCDKFETNALPYSFSPARNGIICGKCRGQNDIGMTRLSISSIKTMQMSRTLPIDKLSRLKISSQSLQEAADILRLYCRFQLQRDINSWKQFELK